MLVRGGLDGLRYGGEGVGCIMFSAWVCKLLFGDGWILWCL